MLAGSPHEAGEVRFAANALESLNADPFHISTEETTSSPTTSPHTANYSPGPPQVLLNHLTKTAQDHSDAYYRLFEEEATHPPQAAPTVPSVLHAPVLPQHLCTILTPFSI